MEKKTTMYQKKIKRKIFLLRRKCSELRLPPSKSFLFSPPFFCQCVVIKLLESSQIWTTSNLNPKLQSTWMNRKKEMDDCCPLLYSIDLHTTSLPGWAGRGPTKFVRKGKNSAHDVSME